MNQVSNIPESRVLRVVAHLRRGGVETTPDEVRANLIEVARKVREEMRRLGWEGIPEDDVGVLDLMAELQSDRKDS